MVMEVLDALDASFDHAEAVVAAVKPETLGDPTPCTEWDVRQLVDHMRGTLVAFKSLLAGGEITGGPESKDPVADFKLAAVELREIWHQPDAFDAVLVDGPLGGMDKEAVARLNMQELLAHSWDLAKATGQDPTLPPKALAQVLPAARDDKSAEYRSESSGMFDGGVGVGADASPSDEFVALLGRRP
jgi:uncharacterized protein (TIGR03086 family)